MEQTEQFRIARYYHEEMVLYIIQGANYENLPHLSLGAKPAQLEQVAKAGLLINPYLSQRKIETSATAEQMLATYDGYPLSAVVFEGGIVPGYPLYTDKMAEALQRRALPAVVYEYNRFPKGLERVAPLTGYNLVVMRPGNINDQPTVHVNGIKERRVQVLELQLRDLASRYGGEELQRELTDRLQLLARS